MKSFLGKALVVALVVVGSVNAKGTKAPENTGFMSKVNGYATSAKKSVVNAVNSADSRIFGSEITKPFPFGEFQKHAGLPVFRSYLNFNNGYVRAAVVAGVVAGAAVAVRAAYNKYVAKPAVEAAEGEENVEAAQ